MQSPHWPRLLAREPWCLAHGVAIRLVWRSVESLARQREGPAVGKSNHRQVRAEWDPDEAVAGPCLQPDGSRLGARSHAASL